MKSIPGHNPVHQMGKGIEAARSVVLWPTFVGAELSTPHHPPVDCKVACHMRGALPEGTAVKWIHPMSGHNLQYWRMTSSEAAKVSWPCLVAYSFSETWAALWELEKATPLEKEEVSFLGMRAGSSSCFSWELREVARREVRRFDVVVAPYSASSGLLRSGQP